MQEYRIKATQEMVDYVESHRSGDVCYTEDFKLEVGETCVIDGWGLDDRLFLMSKENGIKFRMPEDMTGLNIDDYKKAWDERQLQEDMMKVDWADVRIKAAIHILGGMVADKCIRVDEDDDNKEELQRQERTVRCCAYTALKYVDALIDELRK